MEFEEQWSVVDLLEYNGEIHCIPISDIGIHRVSKWCPCRPEIADECDHGAVYTHNSFDGREHREVDHNRSTCPTCVNSLIKVIQVRQKIEDGLL